MKTVLLAALVAAALFVLLILKKAKRREQPTNRPDFYGKKPLTAIEQVLYFRLLDALPEHIVLAQVQLSQIVGIKKGPLWQTWFNKISRKSVDFLICRKDASVIAAIELDDKSHEKDDRRERDADKDAAISGAGLRVIRWTVKDIPSAEAIRQTLLSPS